MRHRRRNCINNDVHATSRACKHTTIPVQNHSLQSSEFHPNFTRFPREWMNRNKDCEHITFMRIAKIAFSVGLLTEPIGLCLSIGVAPCRLPWPCDAVWKLPCGAHIHSTLLRVSGIRIWVTKRKHQCCLLGICCTNSINRTIATMNHGQMAVTEITRTGSTTTSNEHQDVYK